MQIEKESFPGVKEGPKVSICVVTYNQKEYLKECLDGLIAQKFSFDYEVIVGDDASTDGTTDVVKEYSRRYPGLIVPLLHSENVGPFKNYLLTHAAAKGRYVCHMDGDDLAYANKINTQNDFLDKNKFHQIVWHRVKIFSDDGCLLKDSEDVGVFGIDRLNLKQSDLLMYGSIGFHSAMMYRNDSHTKNLLNQIKESNVEFIDYFIAVELLSSGRLAASLKDVLGGYRYNSNQQTLSKANKGIFRKSKTKVLLLGHLNYFFEKYPELRSRIFVHTLTNALGDIHHMRGTAGGYSLLAFKCVSLEGVMLFLKSLKTIKRRRIV
jgi:glycosyltransferase involved in cell wall biosynthesis